MPDISRELFLQWRSPRRGNANPTPMSNPVWESLIHSGDNAYVANKKFRGPSPFDTGPGWCFDRFGQSSTKLPDGREVLVAGEHEDYYDPDFYIYNDVVVRHPDGAIDIYGYPESDFPPTDFHTASFVGDRIVLIGNLGYLKGRRAGFTQVLVMSLKDFSVKPARTQGDGPGWLHRHEAQVSHDGRSIRVRKGMVHTDPDRSLVENVDSWTLYLDHWRWERTEERPWQQWTVLPRDRKRSYLWRLRHLAWLGEMGRSGHFIQETEEEWRKLTADLGQTPDPNGLAALYQPPVAHETVPIDEDEEERVFRIAIDGVTVRYVENMSDIRVVVEGELPDTVVKVLQEDLLRKLAALENTPWQLD